MSKFTLVWSICPVCGFDNLHRPVKEWEICPCCLTEFGVSDRDWTYEELREDWVAHGALWAWGSKDIPVPPGWNAEEQLNTLKTLYRTRQS